MENEIHTFNNVKNTRLLKLGILGWGVSLSIAILYLFLRISRWSLVDLTILPIILVFTSSVPFIMVWQIEYLGRPYRICIGNEGLTIHRHYHSEQILIPWNKVICIYSASSDPAISNNRVVKDGYLAFRNEHKKKGREVLTMNTNIADAAREKYWEVIGTFPPLRLQFQ
jgi:hypothetical protein